jgi:hypothetical protein
VSRWGEIFLGVIAVTTVATALAQIALLVAAGLLVRRLARFVERMERDLQPAVEHLNAIAKDASRAASLATAQVERVDQLVRDVTQRLEQFVLGFRLFSGRGGRGAAAFSALRAAVNAIRNGKTRRRTTRTDDEDALFI